MTVPMTAMEVLAHMNRMDAERRAFRRFWLSEMLPVLLQMDLRPGDVTIAQHNAWARWREAYDT